MLQLPRRDGADVSLVRRRHPVFAFDVEPTVETTPCGCCDGLTVRSSAAVRRDGAPSASHWLVRYPESNEAWLDAALGSVDHDLYHVGPR